MCNHGGYHNVCQVFYPLRASDAHSSNRLAGNGAMRTIEPHFTNNTSAAYIGVVGSLILSPPLYLLYLLIPRSPGVSRSESDKTCFQASTVIVFPLYSTIIGAIGSSVLLYCRVDLGGIDISNSSFAAFLGSLFLILPAMSCFRFFPLLISFIISSIWSAIMRGVQWLHVKLAENWMDRSYGSYGSRGDDPEISMEFQSPPGRD